MTSRDRLLAILKDEPFDVTATPDEWYYVKDVKANKVVSPAMWRDEARALCTDLNARRRLKRLCEEISTAIQTQAEICPAYRDYPTHRDICNTLAAAILAIGEDNEQTTS